MDLKKEVDRVMSGESADTAATTEVDSPSFFKSEVKEAKAGLTHGGDEVSKEFGDRIKGLNRLEKLVRESEGTERKLSEISHESIMEVHRTAKAGEKVQLDYLFMHQAFRENGKAGPEESHELTLAGLVDLGDRDPSSIEWDKIHNDPELAGKSLICYKPIKKNNGWLGNPSKTDEVEVIIVLNNGKTPETNTVVTALLKHEGGILKWGEGEHGLYNIRSEKEFRDNVSRKYFLTPEQKLCKGEITIAEYQEQYRKIDPAGRTLREAWNDWDKIVSKEPSPLDTHAGEKIAKKNEINDKRQRLIAELSHGYEKKLELVQAAQREVLNSINARVAEINTRNEAIIRNSFFSQIKRLSLITPPSAENTQLIADIIKIIIKDSGGTEAEIRRLAEI